MAPTSIRWDNPSTWVYPGLDTDLPEPSPATSPVPTHVSGWSSTRPTDDIDELDLNDVRFTDLDVRDFLLRSHDDDDDLGRMQPLPPSSSGATFSDSELFGEGIVGCIDDEDERPSTPRDLLFSADLEFLVQVSGDGEGKPMLTSDDLHCRIAKHLQEAGFFSPGYLQHDDISLDRKGKRVSPQNQSDSKIGEDLWLVKISEETHQLPENNHPEDSDEDSDEDESPFQTWKLVRVLSPLTPFHPKTIQNFNTLLRTLKTTPDLVIGLDHTPRLQVNIKPQNDDFTLRDTKRLAELLYAASPLLDCLHARYCGSGSLIAPGIEFAKVFHFLPYTHLSDAEWRAPREETVFTHDPAATSTKMLMKPEVKRGSGIAQCAQRSIAACESVEAIVTAMEIRVMGDDGVVRTIPGAYDFSNLVDPEPRNRSIQFRQHAGTMDFGAVENWVRVCHGMVSFAVNAPDHMFNHVMQLTQTSDSASNSYTIDDLLLELDLRSEAEYYRSKGPNPFVPDLERLRRKPAVNLEDTPDLSPYSFGLEFEMIFPYNMAQDKTSGLAYESANRDKLAEAFNRAGFFSVNEDRLIILQRQGFQKLADNLGYRIEILPKFNPRYQTWYLKGDISISWFDSGVLGYSGGIRGCELTSPVLRDQEEDFEKMLGIVKLIRSEARPMLDPSCGLHVHVGNVRNFSFRSLKRIVTMAWAVDPIISTLVHPSRADSPFSLCLRLGSQLGKEDDLPAFSGVEGQQPEKLLMLEIASHLPMDKLEDSLQKEFYRIWDAESLLTLKKMLETPAGSRSAVSVSSIDRADVPRPVGRLGGRHDSVAIKRPDARILCGTIEFRGLEGTLDPVLVAHWVKLLLAIVEKAESVTVWRFYKMMEEILVKPADDEQGLVLMLKALGLESAQEYWANVAAKNRALIKSGKFATLRTRPDASEEEDDPAYRRWLEESIDPVPRLPEDAADQMRQAISRNTETNR